MTELYIVWSSMWNPIISQHIQKPDGPTHSHTLCLNSLVPNKYASSTNLRQNAQQ